MLTRREKLLIRPWQLRRYNNHRKKVLTALPAIDFGPPPQRGHVTCKLKKLQWERERRTKIEEDNFRLLQRMGTIMKKNRLDNHWETKPPTFLHRVGIYHRTRSPSPFQELSAASTPETPLTRKSRCVACTPSQEKPKQVPEERIPWEPPKKSVSRRRSSSTTLPLTSDFDFPQSKQSDNKYRYAYHYSRSQPVSAVAKSTRLKSDSTESTERPYSSQDKARLPMLSKRRAKSATREPQAEQRLVVQQGTLQLAVNFPPHAQVKLTTTKGDKYLQRIHCECGALKSVKDDSNLELSYDYDCDEPLTY